MPVSKKKRQELYDKYNGLCGYTGKPLDEKWQVDHIMPECYYRWGVAKGDVHCDDNLIPSIRIINHYKRGKDLEEWRGFIGTLHKRLAKLPKKTIVEKTRKRVEYLQQVATLFGITPDKPFCGKFYFETL